MVDRRNVINLTGRTSTDLPAPPPGGAGPAPDLDGAAAEPAEPRSALRFRVLGTLEIVDDRGRTFTPTAPKLRQTLALLLLNANKVTPTASLVQELWGDDPPLSASTTLQTYIYQLRKTFAQGSFCGGEDVLVTKPPGYLLQVDRSGLDVSEFEDLVDQGRAAMEVGDPLRASHLLSRGLGLWTGQALADVLAGQLLEAQLVRLDELRITAMELRIEADLALGRHRQLIGELKWLVSSHRLNEWLYGRLMEALYRSGRRSEALAVYQRLRTVLDDELGLEPSEEMRLLQHEMLTAGSRSVPAARSRMPADRLAQR